MDIVDMDIVDMDHIASAQRVPDTRPKPEIFFNTQSIPEIFSESLGIRYFRI